MWSRDHMYLCIKKEFKDYSVLFLNQIRSARKTIAEFVIYCSFSDSCVQLSGKEKEATMSRTIQKNTQRKGEQYIGIFFVIMSAAMMTKTRMIRKPCNIMISPFSFLFSLTRSRVEFLNYRASTASLNAAVTA